MKLLQFFKPEKQLFKVLSLNTISVLVKLISGFTLSKIIAIYIGPQGIGLIGNLRSFINSVQSIASLGFSNGIIKYVSEHKKNKTELSKTLSTVLFISFFSILLIAIILYFSASYWSHKILNTIDYVPIIKLLALGILFHTLNYFCLAIINGFGKYKTYTILNIVISIFTLLIFIYLILTFKLKGMLYGIVIVPALAFLVTLILIFQKRSFIMPLLKLKNISWSSFKNLIEYSIMALVTAILVPPTLIAIRNHIVTIDGLESMGYWEAMNRISNYYLIFITSLLNLYLFPKLANLTSDKEYRKEIFNFYRTLLPIVIIGLTTLFLIRSQVINLLLSKEFMPMTNLFSWQLLGDFFKILSSVLAYQFLAKKLTRNYILTEVISVIIWYSSSVFLINKFGYVGASMGYLVCYFIYFIMMLVLFRKKLFLKNILKK